MADSVLFSIDPYLLQDHFADSGEPMSFEAVETRLLQMGNKTDDNGWIAEELSLMVLDRTEYRIPRRP